LHDFENRSRKENIGQRAIKVSKRTNIGPSIVDIRT